jgi:twinkle protein
MDTIQSLIEELPYGHSRVVCPECGPDRKKSNERTLSVDIKDGRAVWFCHHCDCSGGHTMGEDMQDSVGFIEEEPSGATSIEEVSSWTELTDPQLEWLMGRGITPDVAKGNGLVSGSIFIKKRVSEVDCIGFPYKNADGSSAVKWRDGAKNFSQTGSAQSLWNIENFSGGDLIICEGEMDVLSFATAEIFSVSVPNGAPAKEVKNISSKKFSYLWDFKKQIDSADRIILACDADGPGKALSNEIARRVGKARCWKVSFPEGTKDANDVLLKHGKDGLVKLVESASPWPIGGLRDPSEYKDDALEIFRSGFQPGAGCGITGVDNIFRVLPQTLTVVTGIPGSGKSTFLTWLSVQLALNHDYRCAVLSAETSSQIHLIQMASILKQKPYRGADRMSESDLTEAIDWLSERFVFIDESDTEINSVLDRTHAAILRNGIRLLIVDPYNFLTGSMDDVAGINKLLVSLKSFAVEHGIAIWLVAHPVKMYPQQDGTTPVPTGYSVAGSSSFFNVCDSGLTVSRKDTGESLITCWKSRFPWVGETGEATVNFDKETLVFSELWPDMGELDFD